MTTSRVAVPADDLVLVADPERLRRGDVCAGRAERRWRRRSRKRTHRPDVLRVGSGQFATECRFPMRRRRGSCSARHPHLAGNLATPPGRLRARPRKAQSPSRTRHVLVARGTTRPPAYSVGQERVTSDRTERRSLAGGRARVSTRGACEFGDPPQPDRTWVESSVFIAGGASWRGRQDPSFSVRSWIGVALLARVVDCP